MECPKCGAESQADREECSSCGIIFARWQQRQQFPAIQRPVVESTSEKPLIPLWMIVAALALVVVSGLILTSRRRAARANANPDDILNELNVKGMKQRRRLADEVAKARGQMWASRQAVAPPSLPADVSESDLRTILEQCAYFQQVVVLEIPKQFPKYLYGEMAGRYPALAGAQREHLVEFLPPPDLAASSDMIRVTLTPFASSKVDLSERPDETYLFGIGRRRVDVVKGSRVSESELSISYDWKYEKAVGAALAPDWMYHSGGATLRRTSTGWNLARAWINTQTAGQTICQ